jgi:hypothetical protein
VIPPPCSVLPYVELSTYVPLTFHGHLHNVRCHCEGNPAWLGGEHDGAEGAEPSTAEGLVRLRQNLSFVISPLSKTTAE